MTDLPKLPARVNELKNGEMAATFEENDEAVDALQTEIDAIHQIIKP